MLPNKLFHIGGDEVQYQCWRTDPKMAAYLVARNVTQEQLYREFETRIFGILSKLGKSTVTWNSVFDSFASAGLRMPADSVVHSYQGGAPAVAKIAKAGHRVISSGLKGYYLAKQVPWTSIFKEELMPTGLTPSEEANVLGGAAAMWGGDHGRLGY